LLFRTNRKPRAIHHCELNEITSNFKGFDGRSFADGLDNREFATVTLHSAVTPETVELLCVANHHTAQWVQRTYNSV
jgi:hypothetical protein